MKIFRLFSAIIVLQTATILAQSLAAHEWKPLSRNKRVAAEENNSTCSTERLKLPVAGAILKRRQEQNNSSLGPFFTGEKAEFVCNDGYRLQGGQLKSFICQGDGKWKENSPSRSGKSLQHSKQFSQKITVDITQKTVCYHNVCHTKQYQHYFMSLQVSQNVLVIFCVYAEHLCNFF